MSKKLTLPVLLYCLLFLILHPHDVAICVSQTLVLWYQNVLPALLPALLLVHLLLGSQKNHVHPELFCMFVGLFCGFPLGCHCVCEAIQKGQISREKGQLYATAFSQFSPVFLSSYVASTMLELPVKTVLFILYASHFVLFLPLYKLACGKKQTFLKNEIVTESNKNSRSFFMLLDQAIVKSSDTLVKIGGYMLVCSMIRTMLQNMLNNRLLLVLVAGCLETTSGIAFTAANFTSLILKRPLIFAFTAFGGLCGLFQVSRQLETAGLNKGFYFCFKVAAALIAVMLYLLETSLLNNL